METKQRAGVAVAVVAGLGLSFATGMAVAGRGDGPGLPVAVGQDRLPSTGRSCSPTPTSR